MRQRIQKILSARGVASRRHAEEMILAGRVTCNGLPCALGDSADPDVDVLCVDGSPIVDVGDRVYLMLNKPRGYVTTLSDEKGRRNVSMLVQDCGFRVYPVGRLDMDSEGLLLMTNDGDFANRIMHPKHEINKVYLATVDGFSAVAIEGLEKPIVLDGYPIRKPLVRVLDPGTAEGKNAKIELTIHEGRNRQVRRMCALCGMRVTRLIRIAEGPLKLGKLPSGKWRHLRADEIQAFLE